MSPAAPLLDGRDPQAIAADLLRRLPAFAPELDGMETGAGRALLEVYARYLHAVAERLNEAPAKNQLALLDMVGIDVLPAQAARAPVVFSRGAGGDASAPAATRVAAELPGRDEPVVFETERSIALAAARLAEVVTVRPERDSYADHSAAVGGGRAFELFGEDQPVAHELYLAHDLKLAIAGKATIEVGIDLSVPAAEALALAWEYWDGEAWQELEVASDGTAGLTRRGTVSLTSDCAEAKRRAVRGHDSHWLRARVAVPLVAAAGMRLPEVDRIALATTVNRPDPPGGCAADLVPELAMTGGQTLDLSKAFQPLGPAPGPGAALYLSCEEVFSKPDAQVTVCLEREETAQETADEIAASHGVDVNKARAELEKLRTLSAGLKTTLEGLVSPGTGPLRVDNDQLLDPGQRGEVDAALAAATAAAPVVTDIFDMFDTGGETEADQVLKTGQAGRGLARAIQLLTQDAGLDSAVDELEDALSELEQAMDLNLVFPNHLSDVRSAWTAVAAAMTALGSDALRTGQAILATAQETFKNRVDRISEARSQVNSAKVATDQIIAGLATFTLPKVAAILFDERESLKQPELAWEWWDGARWRDVPELTGTEEVKRLRADGQVTFTVPEGWERSNVGAEDGRWMRVRVVEGDFARLRLVSWTDEKGLTNFMPVVEPRPPALASLTLGYSWTSPDEPADVCFTVNDMRWADRTEAAAWPGEAFAPFATVEDAGPTLYLGFDREPPPGALSLFAGVQELVGAAAQAVRWEWWDGADWSAASAEDETHGLTRPGVVRVLWPGGASAPRYPVALAAGTQVRLLDPRHTVRFSPGEELWLAGPEGGEVVTVAAVTEAALELAAPVAGAYPSATIGRPPLARFGTPRHWLRARLSAGAEPRRTRVDGLHLNSAWARQVQTIENELLGSGTGEPGQVLFLTQTPVLAGEEIEVRELFGPRAEVEEPMLREELARQGMGEDALRLEYDPRDGRLNAVWVRWRGRDNLYFSGPDARDYVVDRTRGRVICGGEGQGRPFPAGRDNIRARVYRAGGGAHSNLEAGTITRVLSGAVAHEVSNPLPARGGADAEPVAAVQRRGPLVLRHRRQAITRSDYEALAREASPAVAFARALPVADAAARLAPGRVRLTVVPFGAEDQPLPTSELRRRVRAFVLARMPMAALGLEVVDPVYLPVSVQAVLAPRRDADPGATVEAAAKAVRKFLHPVSGGPGGSGWPFGRGVCRSDLASVLDRVDEVDRVERLSLVLDGAPVGDTVEVRPDRLVAAGPARIRLGGTED